MPGGDVVILPTYNERENLERIVPAVLAALPGAHVLVVDDGSPDGTGALADGLAGREPRVRVLHRQRKEGLGRAYLAGFRAALDAGYERIYEMDADFSHDPSFLPRLRDAAVDADLVLASRYGAGGAVEGWGLLRQVISRGGNLYAQLILGVPYRDLTGGFKCFHRAVLEGIGLGNVRSNGYAFQIEMTYRAHVHRFRIREVPYTFRDRAVGVSKMSPRIILEAWPRVLELRYRALTGKL